MDYKYVLVTFLLVGILLIFNRIIILNSKKYTLVVVLFSLVFLSGCANNQTNNYTRSQLAGEIIEIPLATALKMKQEGDDFILYFKMDSCSYCFDFENFLDIYLDDHEVQVYEVNLTTEKIYNNIDIIDKVLVSLVGGIKQTPAIYYIESESKVNLLGHSQENYSYDGFDEWIVKYQLDKSN